MIKPSYTQRPFSTIFKLYFKQMSEVGENYRKDKTRGSEIWKSKNYYLVKFSKLNS